MDEKYLWPLVGVVLGWFLTLAASGLKDREESRRQRGRLLAHLLRVRSDLQTLMLVSEQFKDSSESWQEYEVTRIRITDRHFLEPPSQVESLEKSISEIAGISPHLALDLQAMLVLLQKNKRVSLKASSENREAYVKLISVYETGLELIDRRLTRHVRWLAFRHSPITFVRVLYSDRRRKRAATFADTLTRKLLSDVRAELKKDA